MASGDTLIEILGVNFATGASTAQVDERNGHQHAAMDAGTDENATYPIYLPAAYGGGGLTVDVIMTGIATTGNVVLNVYIERIGAAQQDIDADGFAAAQSVTVAVNATSGNTFVGAATFTDGAQMDSLAAGEMGRIRVERDADNGSDTAAGDAEIHWVIVKET